MTTPAEAAQVLAKCAAFDPTFPKPDPVIAHGWAEAFTRYDLPLPDLLDAVTRHYCESADRAMPKHLIHHARDIRRDRAEREKAHRAALPAAASGERRAEVMTLVRALADRKAI
ncbi:hypothetical protein IU500_07110 [Nocardia terpenica]|uniref:hypothetical protein n=1 Tax=Nocardia terpenica TaxID=455432 RepID=UPI001893F9D2|nr:hypothetical protein [Nocardia terpenica]MBF6060546.1 hypothetical protein [Nocardia terpenica]MBF6103806.1 hypothetical protein [Nocardia terpenica]MBF6111820.1 hypothetical protein [Nocardia terpenica]MBF6118027.1 hypothetical protein [Nocardia terpenica]MBF6155247.1 hypothetical protein [Nocardia terpenica]